MDRLSCLREVRGRRGDPWSFMRVFQVSFRKISLYFYFEIYVSLPLLFATQQLTNRLSFLSLPPNITFNRSVLPRLRELSDNLFLYIVSFICKTEEFYLKMITWDHFNSLHQFVSAASDFTIDFYNLKPGSLSTQEDVRTCHKHRVHFTLYFVCLFTLVFGNSCTCILFTGKSLSR